MGDKYLPLTYFPRSPATEKTFRIQEYIHLPNLYLHNQHHPLSLPHHSVFSSYPNSNSSAFLPASRDPYPIIFLPNKPIIQQIPLRPRPSRYLKIILKHQHWYELADLQEADVFTQAGTGTFAELFL